MKRLVPMFGTAALLFGAAAIGCGTDDGAAVSNDADAGGDGAARGDGGAPSDSTKSFTIGGTVTGLRGTGMVLQNNGADDLSVDADGKPRSRAATPTL
jgi:hypothetical protein